MVPRLSCDADNLGQEVPILWLINFLLSFFFFFWSFRLHNSNLSRLTSIVLTLLPFHIYAFNMLLSLELQVIIWYNKKKKKLKVKIKVHWFLGSVWGLRKARKMTQLTKISSTFNLFDCVNSHNFFRQLLSYNFSYIHPGESQPFNCAKI